MAERTPYYYQAKRVVKEFVPTLVAEAAALIDQDWRAMRTPDAAARKEARTALAALEAELAPPSALADAVARGAFLATGYHRHYRGPGGNAVADKPDLPTGAKPTVAPAKPKASLVPPTTDGVMDLIRRAEAGDQSALPAVREVVTDRRKVLLVNHARRRRCRPAIPAS